MTSDAPFDVDAFVEALPDLSPHDLRSTYMRALKTVAFIPEDDRPDWAATAWEALEDEVDRRDGFGFEF